MKEEGNGVRKGASITILVTFILSMTVIVTNLSGSGELTYDDMEQDSNGNNHRVYIDNRSGDYYLNYTNDIGGDFPEDWNPSVNLVSSNNELLIYEFDINSSSDRIFIRWTDKTSDYYLASEDYGSSWIGPFHYTSNQLISLKYAIFDPIHGEPYIPDNLRVQDNLGPYEYYLVQHTTSPQIVHDDIRAVGGIFCGYIPYHSYIIWMNDTIKREVEQLSYIRWIGYNQPAYKIPADLLFKDGLIELNVLVFEETGFEINMEKVISEIESLGGLILYNGSSFPKIITRILADKIYDIANIPEVTWIDERGEWWPRPPIELHHISMIYEVPKIFNISETQNFTAVGWEDANETDLNRAWEPVWHVEGDIGDIIGDGFTVEFKATKPGNGTIVCTDNETGKNQSIKIQVIGELEEETERDSKSEFPRMLILIFTIVTIIIFTAGVIVQIMRFPKRK